jgi:arginyl-tRNA synthetase
MEALLGEIKDMVMEKIADREFSATEKAEIAETVALGAIRYTILRQSIGGDVIFDSAASISFEGDSGPYLQYAAVRANSILEKAQKEGVRSTEKGAAPIALPEHVSLVEKLISRFPDIVERARIEYSPQHVANYLVALAGAFNAYYAANQIVSDTDPLSPYRVDLTKAFHTVMVNGLWLLGIKVPKRM